MSQSPDRDRPLHATTEQAVEGLVEIGRLWASHGLNIGRAALETSAATLRVTSSVLGEISEQLDRPTASARATDDAATEAPEASSAPEPDVTAPE